ncbi:MAG: phosphate ABC transporter permease subunit PstC, partial [Prochlorothrix sp.]
MNPESPPPAGGTALPVQLWKPNRTLSYRVELAVQIIFAAFALISVATTIGIVATLVFETWEFFKEVPVWKFLTQTKWTPLFGSAQFGIMVLISATLRTSAISMLVAIPLGMLAAICLS